MTISLSIVTPVFQAAEFLSEFHQRMSEVAVQLTDSYEIIYVNDGSTDASLEQLLAIHQNDSRAVIIDLMRNFGQTSAIRTGLAHAKGDHIFIIDDDLEQRPEWLPEFFKQIQETNSDIIFSAQAKRQGTLFEKITGILFFFILKRIFSATVIPNVMTTRLMTKEHAQIMCALKERKASLTALSLWTGCKYKVLQYNKDVNNTTAYSFKKRVKLMLNHLASASALPLYWPYKLTLIWLCACLVYAIVGLFAVEEANFNCYMGNVLLISGIGFVLVSLAVIGLYLGQVYDDLRGRPLAIVRQIYRREDGSPSATR